jgi:hypothetical protein
MMGNGPLELSRIRSAAGKRGTLAHPLVNWRNIPITLTIGNGVPPYCRFKPATQGAQSVRPKSSTSKPAASAHTLDFVPILELPADYARQYLIEHPVFGPPLSKCGAGALARESNQETCGADTLVREVQPTTAAQRRGEAAPAAQREAPAVAPRQNVSQESPTQEPAAKRRQNTAHGASRGSKTENNPAPKERKKPEREAQENELERVQAAIAGAERGNWRDLRTVFEFAGIDQRTRDVPPEQAGDGLRPMRPRTPEPGCVFSGRAGDRRRAGRPRPRCRLRRPRVPS